jgi:phosphoenolpyruvate---glycerone phosphotransferase subunit DhaK
MFKGVRKYYSTRVRAAAVVDELFEAVADDLPFERGDEVALMINGLGGTPLSELYLLYRRAAIRAMDRSVKVIRAFVANYCTSLEMAGFSLTLLRLDSDSKILLDAPADIPWRVF